MKKTISLILTLCIVTLTCAWSAENCFLEQDANPKLQIYTSSEFFSKLEDKNIDVNDAEAYDICVLIELQDPLANNWFFDVSNISSNDDIDTALREHRNNVKEYYTDYNKAVIIASGLDSYDYHLSYYSPYIEIVFDNLAEYTVHENQLLDVICDAEKIISACNYATIEETHYEATIDAENYSIDYPLDEAFEDIDVYGSSYTGNGVKVGVIDVDIPLASLTLKEGKYTIIEGGQIGLHSTVITSIIGGNSGIAEDVHLYCMAETHHLIEDCNTMIADYDVNIINMSLWHACVGYYTNYDACIDNIVANTKCTFVKSAGNRGQEKYSYDYLVTAPGCAMNAITVGSVNANLNLSYFSSWIVSDNFLFKPDVVAPGGNLSDIPILSDYFDESFRGTSFAAPMVVGTIALLMEEFPMLKTNPALVKSALHLGAEKLPSQIDYFDEQAGFGLINYQNMREYLLNMTFYNFTILPAATTGDTVLSYTIAIPPSQKIYINANSIINSSNEIENEERAVLVYADYTIKIFDLTASTYVASSTLDSSVDYLIYQNDTTNSSFRIDIVLESDNVSGLSEFGALVYEIHEHSWDSCVYLNKLLHQDVCACGTTGGTGRHYVSGDHLGDDWVPCAGCGYLLDMRHEIHEGIMSITQVSVNGSYIRSDGIVVLVDEDIEAYLAGTLQFYHPEDVPVTQ